MAARRLFRVSFFTLFVLFDLTGNGLFYIKKTKLKTTYDL